jgi:hypothetical protein
MVAAKEHFRNVLNEDASHIGAILHIRLIG